MPAPREALMIRDFQGVITNMSSEDLPEGAAEVQVNVTGVRAGELRTRGGLKEITFDSEG
jgi:hypothetical protein